MLASHAEYANGTDEECPSESRENEYWANKSFRNGEAQETILALPTTLRVAATDQIVNAVERILGTGVMYFR